MRGVRGGASWAAGGRAELRAGGTAGVEQLGVGGDELADPRRVAAVRRLEQPPAPRVEGARRGRRALQALDDLLEAERARLVEGRLPAVVARARVGAVRDEQVDHRGLPEPRRNVQRRRAARAAEVDAEAEGARQQLLHLLHVAVARRVEQLPVIDQLVARELQAERAGDGARRGGASARERAVEVEVADVVEQAAAERRGALDIHLRGQRAAVNARWRRACRVWLSVAAARAGELKIGVTAKKRLNR